MSINKVLIIGRLTRDPDLKTLPDGKKICNFSVATNETWVDKDNNKKERVEYHNISTWESLAEICSNHLAKGRQVFVEGKLQTRSWEDKDTGKKCYATNIVATTVEFLGNKEVTKTENDPGMVTDPIPF